MYYCFYGFNNIINCCYFCSWNGTYIERNYDPETLIVNPGTHKEYERTSFVGHIECNGDEDTLGSCTSTPPDQEMCFKKDVAVRCGTLPAQLAGRPIWCETVSHGYLLYDKARVGVNAFICDISRMRLDHIRWATTTKVGMWGEVADVINHAKFHARFRLTEGSKLAKSKTTRGNFRPQIDWTPFEFCNQTWQAKSYGIGLDFS